MADAGHPLVELTRARIRETVREPGIVFWVFGFPILMAVFLGLAFRSRPPQAIPIAVGGPAAAWVLEALETVPEITAERLVTEEAAEALRVGRVDLVVEATRAEDGDSSGPRLRYRFDPTRPQSAATRLLVDDALQRAAGRIDPVPREEVTVTAPGARYIDFLLPGLIGLNLMSSSMWGVGFAIVVMRTRKLLKRFAATPMRRSHFLLSLLLSRLVFLTTEVTVLVAFGWLVFGVAVRGSLAAFALISVLGAASFAGIGMLTAARTKTVEVASGLMNAVTLPLWLVGGVFFSAARFPDALQPALRLLPLNALNDALRAIVNDGAGVTGIATEAVVLAGWTAASFALALRWFRWQ